MRVKRFYDNCESAWCKRFRENGQFRPTPSQLGRFRTYIYPITPYIPNGFVPGLTNTCV